MNPPLDHPPQGHWYCPPCVESLPGYHQSVEPQVAGSGKGKARAAVLSSDSSSSSECDDDTEDGNQTTPLIKRRARNAKDRSQPIESVRSAKKKKRKRPRLQVVPPLRIRLKRNGQGGEEDPVKGLFDDILTVDQRDTSKTAITHSDKIRFDRSRFAAEVSTLLIVLIHLTCARLNLLYQPAYETLNNQKLVHLHAHYVQQLCNRLPPQVLRSLPHLLPPVHFRHFSCQVPNLNYEYAQSVLGSMILRLGLMLLSRRSMQTYLMGDFGYVSSV